MVKQMSPLCIFSFIINGALSEVSEIPERSIFCAYTVLLKRPPMDSPLYAVPFLTRLRRAEGICHLSHT